MSFDDYRNYHFRYQMPPQQQHGCCGTCCLYMIAVPAAIIALILKIAHVI